MNLIRILFKPTKVISVSGEKTWPTRYGPIWQKGSVRKIKRYTFKGTFIEYQIADIESACSTEGDCVTYNTWSDDTSIDSIRDIKISKII